MCYHTLLRVNKDIHSFIQECWKNDPRVPLFEIGCPSRYSLREACHILSQMSVTSTKCTWQPLKVRQNACFLIDLKWLSHWEDVKADMNGIYTGVFQCSPWTVECQADSCSVLARKEIFMTSSRTYHLVMNSKKNKAAPSLACSLFLLKDRNRDFMNVCLLQHHGNKSSGSVDFDVQQHGNVRGMDKNSFYPTKKSTMSKMRECVEHKGLQGIYDHLRRSAGGVCGARTVFCFAARKASDLQCEIKNKPCQHLKYARDHENIILHHLDYPEDLWVFGKFSMSADLTRFTTSTDVCCKASWLLE